MKRGAVRFPSMLANRILATRHVSAVVPPGAATAIYRTDILSQPPCRNFSQSKSPEGTEANGEMNEKGANAEDFEPNFEQTHPLSSLEGDRGSYTVPITVRMPDMGEEDNNMVEQWYKEPGDIIKRNDILCDIATPDFTFGMMTEDEHDAIMGEILVEAEQKADGGAPICVIYHPENPKTKGESDGEK
jgi:hypothetical protein